MPQVPEGESKKPSLSSPYSTAIATPTHPEFPGYHGANEREERKGNPFVSMLSTATATVQRRGFAGVTFAEASKQRAPPPDSDGPSYPPRLPSPPPLLPFLSLSLSGAWKRRTTDMRPRWGETSSGGEFWCAVWMEPRNRIIGLGRSESRVKQSKLGRIRIELQRFNRGRHGVCLSSSDKI